MEVRRGYKKTEVGVIPDKWDVKPLGDLFGFSGGYSASRDQLSTEGHCYLHYGDIHGATKTWVDTRVDYQDIPKLDIPLKRVSSRSLLEDGDVVFVDASEDDEGTSKHVVVMNKENVPFISGLHTIVAKSRTDELVHEYRRYCFQTAAIRQQFLFYAVGTKVLGISKSNIPKLFLPLPTPPEQHAIATALSDVDALLSGLDRLIAKKRDLKQAAMQKLLTGQTRLPGFHGVWEVKQLGEIAQLKNGYAFQSSTYTDFGHYKVVTIANVQDGSMTVVECSKIALLPRDIQSHQRLCRNDILISMTGNVGRVCRVNYDDCLLNQRVGKLVPTGIDDRFLFSVLSQRKFLVAIGLKAKGGAQGNLSKSDITEYEVAIPFDIEEQTAIATVLSDMDAELAALVARRDKTRDLKQAMMQELLTGKTRLVS
ncbi:MAG: restriction endonuclease subunit S, partial [Planctomycetota bacterium]